MMLEAKTVRTLTGILLCPLAVGSKALIVHQGKITRTARIMAIHHRTADEVTVGLLLPHRSCTAVKKSEASGSTVSTSRAKWTQSVKH